MGLKAYTGDTRARRTIAKLRAARIGKLVVRGRLRDVPDCSWVYDNGVFEDYKAGKEWNARAEAEFIHDIIDIVRLPKKHRPDWIALPDAVGKSEQSGRNTAWMLHLLRQAGLTQEGLKFAYVVQDSMDPAPNGGFAHRLKFDLSRGDGIETIFVGGSTEWKWSTAAAWSRLAHSFGLNCHIGRAGSVKRVEQATGANANSIDSCLPLWSNDMLDRWIAAINRSNSQLSLFTGEQ